MCSCTVRCPRAFSILNVVGAVAGAAPAAATGGGGAGFDPEADFFDPENEAAPQKDGLRVPDEACAVGFAAAGGWLACALLGVVV
jgi:hypothetical protein